MTCRERVSDMAGTRSRGPRGQNTALVQNRFVDTSAVLDSTDREAEIVGSAAYILRNDLSNKWYEKTGPTLIEQAVVLMGWLEDHKVIMTILIIF